MIIFGTHSTNTNFNIMIINAKLTLYQTAFDADVFTQKVDSLEATWESDLRPLLGQIPDFVLVAERVSVAFGATR